MRYCFPFRSFSYSTTINNYETHPIKRLYPTNAHIDWDTLFGFIISRFSFFFISSFSNLKLNKLPNSVLIVCIKTNICMNHYKQTHFCGLRYSDGKYCKYIFNSTIKNRSWHLL